MTNTPKYIVIHCSDVSYDLNPNQYFGIDRYHEERGFPLSSLGRHGGYHILIEADTAATELRYREDWEIGAHCNDIVDGKSMNEQSLGICLTMDGDIEFPKPAQTERLRARLKEWQEKYKIPNERIYFQPHRTWKPSKTCYGSLVATDWAFFLLNPPPKEPEQVEKKKQIEAQITSLKQQIMDLLNLIILKLKIELDVANKRQKTPPQP